MSIITAAAATALANAAKILIELTQKLDAIATDKRLREHIFPIREEILRVKELVFEAKQAQLQAMTALEQEYAALQQAQAEFDAKRHRLQFPDQQPTLEPLQEQILVFLANRGDCHLIHISGHIKAGDELLRFHLAELTNMGLLNHSCETWSIAQPGRKYLISHGLLT